MAPEEAADRLRPEAQAQEAPEEPAGVALLAPPPAKRTAKAPVW